MIAIHAAEAGTAILVYQHDAAGRIDVEAIERLPAGLDPAADWLAGAAQDEQLVLDAAGLGRALWDKLAPRGRQGWRLYRGYGRERQELVNALLVAMSDRRIHIAESPHRDAMRRALASFKRLVGDDGVIGGELVIALALAARFRPRPPMVVRTLGHDDLPPRDELPAWVRAAMRI